MPTHFFSRSFSPFYPGVTFYSLILLFFSELHDLSPLNVSIRERSGLPLSHDLSRPLFFWLPFRFFDTLYFFFLAVRQGFFPYGNFLFLRIGIVCTPLFLVLGWFLAPTPTLLSSIGEPLSFPGLWRSGSLPKV